MEMNCFRYSLSVIIPIHRAELDIERCINSLLDNDRLELQIIIVANCASRDELDRINQKIRNRYTHYRCITLLNIRKGGKANAINQSLSYVKNEIVLIGDADTYFCSEGLLNCLAVISQDNTVVAVTGDVDVNKKNLLSCVQHFEYRRIYNIFRPLMNHFNWNLMVSGCAGIFRTKCLIEVGLYDTQTLGEDYEISLRLHEYYIRRGMTYKIEYVNTTLAKTDVPMSMKSLIRQRGRWFRGFLEVTKKYRMIIKHPIRYKKIVIPYIFSVILNKWTCYLKWMLILISIWICINNGVFFLTGILAYWFCFGIIVIIFNSAFAHRLKLSKRRLRAIVKIVFMTVCLMALQFVLKDTSLFQAAFLNRKKENKWK